jgi:hypothetical protein
MEFLQTVDQQLSEALTTIEETITLINKKSE